MHAGAAGRPGRRGGRWSLVTVDSDSTEPAVADVAAGVDDAEELLVEEISIDGMCGVY